MNALNNASVQDFHSSGFASFAFPKAKSSKLGVSVEYVPDAAKQWYVLRIRYGKTQEMADTLISRGDYAYVAMVWKIERKDGKKRKYLAPFLNLVFAYLTEQQAEAYVKDSPESRFITYYYNHFKLNHEGKNPPLTIRERDIQLIIRTTAQTNEHVMQIDLQRCRFVSNDLVRVTEGPFEGIVGRVVRVARQNRVAIFVEGLQAGITTAYIPPHCLEKVH